MSENRKIASALERLRCREHGEHPTVTPKQDGVSVSCCCEKFKDSILEKYKEEAEKILQRQIEEEIKKMFR